MVIEREWRCRRVRGYKLLLYEEIKGLNLKIKLRSEINQFVFNEVKYKENKNIGGFESRRIIIF